ncbi:MAG TPA: Fic family protein [Anaerolineales bacterium]|nr:Fic family protein [Anaerolineales bacterium]
MDPKDFSETSPGRVLRTSQGYWAFIPNQLPPSINWSAPLISALGEAERNLGRLASLADTLPSAHIIARPFTRREAVLSSRIEGTRASFVDLYRYESTQLSPLETPSDVKEVHNYVRALDYGLKRLDELLVSLRLIREMHGILMEGVHGNYLTPGEFRRSQNWIGIPGSTLENATMVPPPVDEMHTALDGLQKFIHAPSEIPQLVRAGLIHYQFEAIHPFLDGNGRVGRLLVILLLVQWGLISQPLLYLSAFFEAHRLDYYNHLLRVSQRGEWEGWLVFFLMGVSSQAQDAITRIERLGKLRTAYQERLRSERAAERLFQTLDVLFERPILNIRQLEAALDVPYRTAQRYVERLVKIGILREVTGRSRNRLYRAEEILRALEE